MNGSGITTAQNNIVKWFFLQHDSSSITIVLAYERFLPRQFKLRAFFMNNCRWTFTLKCKSLQWNMWEENLQCRPESHLTLIFTSVFLLPHVSTVNFYFLMQTSGGVYETGRDSFCLLRVSVLQQLTTIVSWEWKSVSVLSFTEVMLTLSRHSHEHSVWNETYYKLRKTWQCLHVPT